MPQIVIKSPIGGINRRTDFQSQPPYSTFDSLNFWPTDPLTGRLCVATRPPLVLFGEDQRQVTMLSRVSGISTLGPPQSFAAAFNGTLYYWNGSEMVTATGNPHRDLISTEGYTSAAPVVNQLVICRPDEPGELPFVFDYPTGAVAPLDVTEGSGDELKGATIAIQGMGALWLAKDSVVYVSRVGNIQDFDYSAVASDLYGAFFTDTEFEGMLAGPITALIPYINDVVLVSTISGLSAFRGHPRQGGVLERVGHTYALGQGAWCKAPDNTVYMLTPLGVMAFQGQGLTPVSRDKIPESLVGVLYNVTDPLVNMVYDSRWNAILIFIRGPQEQAWRLDLTTGGFSRMETASYPFIVDEFPDFITESTSGVLVGGYDGLKLFDRFGDEEFSSSIVFGPVKISQNSVQSGKVTHARFVFARDTPQSSGTVRFSAGVDGQDAINKLQQGLHQYECPLEYLRDNYATCSPHVTGHALAISITGDRGDIAIEEVVVTVEPQGALRAPRSQQLPVLGASTDFTGDFVDLDPGIWAGYSEAIPAIPPDAPLNDFVHILDLSLMPVEWWDNIGASDGSDIRVSDVFNEQLPCKVVGFDQDNSRGMLLFRLSQSTTPKSIRVWTGNQNTVEPAPDSEFGQYNLFDEHWRAFWYDGGGDSDLTGRAPSVTHNFANAVSGALAYGTVDGPLGAPATDFHLGNTTYWGIEDGVVDMELETHPEITFIAMGKLTGTDVGLSSCFLSFFSSFADEVMLQAAGTTTTIAQFRDIISSGFLAQTTASGDATEWNHYAGRRDSLSLRSAWLNGASKANQTGTSASYGDRDDIMVGKNGGLGASGQSYRGQIAMLQIHDTNRSDAFIEYQGKMCKDQVAFWGQIGEFQLINNPPPPIINPIACPLGPVPVPETGTWTGYASATPQNPVSGTVIHFTAMIDLSLMPSSWWSEVTASGVDIRATDTGNRFLPLDLIEFDKTNETGLAAVRTTQAQGGPSAIRLWVGNTSAVTVHPCATYGRYNAYDSLYRGFWPSGSGEDRTQWLNDLEVPGGADPPEVQPGESPVGGEATFFNNNGINPQFVQASITEPTTVPVTLTAFARRPVDTIFTDSVLVGLESGSDSCVQLSTRPSNSPARLVVRNAFGGESTASNSRVLNPVTGWSSVGIAYGNTTRIVHANGGGASYANQEVIVAQNLNQIVIGAENEGTMRSFTGWISMVGLHNAARGSAWADYFHKNLDQDTFWGGEWSWTADSEDLGQ